MRNVAIITAALLLVPAVSQAKSLEDLLVEKGVITKGEAHSAAMGGPSKVYWNGGTRLEFPDTGFETQINTQIQTRYTFTDNDEDTGEKNTSSFDIQRARLIVSGTALNKEFSYMLQTDMVGSNDGNSRSPDLRDAYIQWNACDWGSVRMGQFKTAISRQFNTSSSKLMFADRSAASEFFDLGRQQGAAGKADLMDGKLQVGAGIFNGISDGEGRNRTGVDTKHTGVVNVRWTPIGEMDSYEESDVNYTENAAFSMGAAYAYSDYETGAGLATDGELNSISVDANFKMKGISVNGEFFYQSNDVDGADDEVEPLGFYAQAGYFLVPKKWEIAARYGYVDCDDGSATGDCSGLDKLNEVTAGINYYWWKHNLKAQLNYSILNNDTLSGDDQNTNRWLFQLSSYF